jgi:hypothetical protein
MANVKFGMIVTDMMNKLGGQVFSRNGSGPYVRNLVIPTNPTTIYKTVVKGNMTSLSEMWRTLSPSERKSWNDETVNYLRTNNVGDTYFMSGFQLFMSLNRNLFTAGLTLATTPAAKVIPPDTDTFTVSASFLGASLNVTFGVYPDIADNTYLVYATRGLSAGINYVKSAYRLIAILGLGIGTSYDAYADWTAKYTSFNIGDKIFFKFIGIDNSCGCASIGQTGSGIAT